MASGSQRPQSVSATDAAAELRRAEIEAELARLYRVLGVAPEHQVGWIERRIRTLIAMRDAVAAPAAMPAQDEMPNLAAVPVYLREIVCEHYDRRNAERAEAKQQAAEAIRLVHEETVTAHRRAPSTRPRC
jgi:hypothetical protein